MEFQFNAAAALKTDAEGFAVIDGASPHLYRRPGGGGQGVFGGSASATSSPEQ